MLAAGALEAPRAPVFDDEVKFLFPPLGLTSTQPKPTTTKHSNKQSSPPLEDEAEEEDEELP